MARRAIPIAHFMMHGANLIKRVARESFTVTATASDNSINGQTRAS